MAAMTSVRLISPFWSVSYRASKGSPAVTEWAVTPLADLPEPSASVYLAVARRYLFASAASGV